MCVCVCNKVGTSLCRMELCKVAMEKLIAAQTVSYSSGGPSEREGLGALSTRSGSGFAWT